MDTVVAAVRKFVFADAGAFPNNPHFAVLLYQQVATSAPRTDPEKLAVWFEHIWPQHGWKAAWRWGVYDFPHYHSTAHEVLGVYRGRASLRLGDRTGITLDLEAGDMLVLPAGTAHQNLGSSPDFHVVGGYPQGQTADLLRGDPGDRPDADERIKCVPTPAEDPIAGKNGPLAKEWKS